MLHKKLLLSLFLASLLGGCLDENETNSSQKSSCDNQGFCKIQEKTSNLRNQNPQIDKKYVDKLVKLNNIFAFKLLTKLSKDENNINTFFSPYGIEEIMAMAYSGSSGKAREQIAKSMGFWEKNEILNPSFNQLDLKLIAQEKDYTLEISNALWIDKLFKVENAYQALLGSHYGATITPLELKKNPLSSAEEINQWVNVQSKGRIKKIVESDTMKDTLLVLINSVYFKASWESPFEKYATQKEDFKDNRGKQLKVDMMYKSSEGSSYFQNASFASFSLSYYQNRSKMVLILPHEGKFDTVLKNIESNYQLSQKNDSTYDEYIIDVKLPKFKFATQEYDLKAVFETLGMDAMFTDSSGNFKGISKKEDLKISKFIHKGFIEVNEEGSEAVAISSIEENVTVEENATQEKHQSFYVNRPFIFFIQDTFTQQILFMGIVRDLSQL